MKTPITYTPEVAQLVDFAAWLARPLFGPKPARCEPTPEQLQAAARLLDLVAPRRAVGHEPELVMAEVIAERCALRFAVTDVPGGPITLTLLNGSPEIELTAAEAAVLAGLLSGSMRPDGARIVIEIEPDSRLSIVSYHGGRPDSSYRPMSASFALAEALPQAIGEAMAWVSRPSTDPT